MNAHTTINANPANPTAGHPAQRFPRLLALRVEQVRKFGHTAEKDDARGPQRLVAIGRERLIAVTDMLMGDPSRLTLIERATLENRLDKAITILIAAADALSRIPVAGPQGEDA